MRRHLSYANVAATLALVFAMSGGALAASHYLITSTSQISPKVLKKLKGKAGKTGGTGAAGATGAPGAAGPQGPTGKEGPQGKEGKAGIQGEPGPLLSTLPSGKTLTGVYAIEYTASGAGGTGTSAISFAFPLSADPSGANANFIPAGGSSTGACPGTSANPQAAAGQLCVYESFNTNIASRCLTKPAGEYLCEKASKYGATAYVTSTGAGRAASVGTWAVTAP
jgi:Collagen triple helix repeat (20 copies)